MSWAISSLLHQGLVELPASAWMDSSPAIFTVILQTGNISTEKWSKFSTTTGPLTFITKLIIQDIWLNFHLYSENEKKVTILNDNVDNDNSTRFTVCVLAGLWSQFFRRTYHTREFSLSLHMIITIKQPKLQALENNPAPTVLSDPYNKKQKPMLTIMLPLIYRKDQSTYCYRTDIQTHIKTLGIYLQVWWCTIKLLLFQVGM